MNLIELQTKIHEQNKAMGWWDEPRPFSTFVCLFHSELSEAMEGDKKGLMDDHLPEYPMFQVELADFVIRVFDYLGSTGFSESEYNDISYQLGDLVDSQSKTRLLAGLHLGVSLALSDHEDGNRVGSQCILAALILVLFAYAKDEGFDLHKIILEKVEYNRHRADHQRENRARDGGKKY